MRRHVVARAADVPPGGRTIVRVAGREIGLFNVGGEYFALRNRCPHQGGPLCTGRLSGWLESGEVGRYDYSRPGEVLRCPWHGWEFDVRTGQSWFDPLRTRVRSYDVAVVPGSRLAGESEAEAEAEGGLRKGPYVAETYPVTVEDEYLVVELTA